MSSPPHRKRRPRAGTLTVLGLLGIAGLTTVYFWQTRGGKDDESAAAYHRVARGEFLVSVVEGGNLEAVNEIVVRNELQGTSRIIYIVPEGTNVKKGDLLVELDAGEAEDQLNQQQIQYESSLAKKVAAENALIITRSSVESDISAAELNVQFSEMDLEKFLSVERDQQERNAEIEIITAQEALQIAEEKLRWSEELTEKGFETKSNLDKDRLAVTNQKLALEKAESELQMLRDYDLERLQATYEANLSESRKELERVRKEGESKIAQAEADLRSAIATLELNQSKLEKMQEQLEATKIYAPQDGLVVYAESGSRFSNDSMIEEGASVRQRQELIKIPDISEMKVVVKVHESHVGMVRERAPAFVVLDSLPDQRFRGEVTSVAVLPDTQSRWGNPNLKVYETEIVVQAPLPDVKPGVSARAEIIVAQLQDVITVPIQAVTTRQGQQVCFVKTLTGTELRPVDVGLFNNRFIEIRTGLQEGDRVLLSPPLDEADSLLDNVVGEDEELDDVPTEAPEVKQKPAADSPGESGPRRRNEGNGPRAGEGRPRGDRSATEGKRPPRST